MARPYPDKWDLPRFFDRLEQWSRLNDPPTDVYDEVKAWIDSRQDAPYGDGAYPITSPEHDDAAWYCCPVLDRRRRQVICHGKPVYCTYKVIDEPPIKELVCLEFGDPRTDSSLPAELQ
jgi:hypothetical protein